MTQHREILIEDEATKHFCQQTFSMKKKGLSLLEPFNQIFPTGRYTRFAQRIQEFEVFEDDVWIVSFPKSGSRWITELAWCIRNNVDLKKAKDVSLNDRTPFFEFELVFPFEAPEDKKDGLSFDKVEKLERPRFIKSHLSYDMLPKQIHEKKPKIINLIRNPRDVCLSFRNHFQSWQNYQGDVQSIADMFLKDVGPYYAPYFPHVLGDWKHKDDPNILTLFYEDMKKDLRDAIKKIAEFLDVKLTEEDVEKLNEHCSFDSMKANLMVNFVNEVKGVSQMQQNENPGQMIHKGKSGGWKNNFDEETVKRFEEWEAKWLKDTGLKFTYEV